MKITEWGDYETMGKTNHDEAFVHDGALPMDSEPGQATLEETWGADSVDQENMQLEEEMLEEETVSMAGELAKLKAQNEDYYGQLQRLQAEFDNYRKRTQKEKEEIFQYAAERVLTALLPVVDNFERAIAASRSNSDKESFVQGVDMIFRQLSALMEKEGMKPIEALGKSFDPNFHEAVLQVEADGCEENTVIEELQKGYILKDKLVRPSMVKVAR